MTQWLCLPVDGVRAAVDLELELVNRQVAHSEARRQRCSEDAAPGAAKVTEATRKKVFSGWTEKLSGFT